MCFEGVKGRYRCSANPLSIPFVPSSIFCPRHPSAYSGVVFSSPPSLPRFLLAFSPSLFTSLLLWGHCVLNKDPPLSQPGRQAGRQGRSPAALVARHGTMQSEVKRDWLLHHHHHKHHPPLPLTHSPKAHTVPQKSLAEENKKKTH